MVRHDAATARLSHLIAVVNGNKTSKIDDHMPFPREDPNRVATPEDVKAMFKVKG